MRILMTTDSVGGVWDLSLALCGALRARGHEVVLAHVGPPPRPAHREEAASLGVELVVRDFPLEWMPEGLEAAQACRRWLGELARDTGAEVVHCNSYSHVQASSPIPQVLVAHSSLHGWWSAVHPGQQAPAQWEGYHATVRAALGAADAVVAPSQAMLDELASSYGHAGGHVIHNGLPLPPPCKGARSGIVLTGGRLWDEGKGHGVLDEAAKGLPWPVLATGSRHGPDGEVAFDHIRSLGFLPRDELDAAHCSAAVYANPALYEPFGLGSLEAAARGCALVVSDLPSQREIWGDAAVYARPGDARHWHDALATLTGDPSRCKRLGQAARQRALRFEVNTMARQYENLYEQLRVVVA